VLTTPLFFHRYRREEMKIQAWENRRRQKAELEMKMTEVQYDRVPVSSTCRFKWTCRTAQGEQP
jgi:hypothetical protein